MADARVRQPRIVGVGTDVIDVERVCALVEREGGHFLERWFRPGEVVYCRSEGVDRAAPATLLAVKEAVLKALPGPACQHPPWLSIEVAVAGEGAVTVQLHGGMLERARRAGVGHLSVSITGQERLAMAVVIASGVAG